MAVKKAAPPPYPLYGSTYTVHRLSPLYHGNAPLLSTLNVHAKRMRDAITGDTLRGVEVAAELSGLGTSSGRGALKSCTWDLLGDEESWERQHADQDEDEDEISMASQVGPQEARGVHIELKFESGTHSAILLGDINRKTAVSGFTSLPLLFIRMPAPLKDVLLNYLSTAFDTRCSPMRLRPAFLSSALEAVLASGSEDRESVPSNGLQVQLAFPAAAPLLKNIDLVISRQDVTDFLDSDEAVRGNPSPAITGPFTAALSRYLDHHMAFSLNNPAVVLAKVAIGPFAFASDGKVKMMSSSPVAQSIWDMMMLQETLSKDLQNIASSRNHQGT
jgi:hypothetical protein